jgi:transcriptional regulator with XRE-family HTH domain
MVEIDGAALRVERERAGLSVEDVSRRTGLEPATLRRLEDARPTLVRPRTVRKVARAIGVAAEQLSQGSR